MGLEDWGSRTTQGGRTDENDASTDPAAPPPIPPKITGEQVEPSVVIRKDEDKLVEEYSLNGKVYMVRITPEIAGRRSR